MRELNATTLGEIADDLRTEFLCSTVLIVVVEDRNYDDDAGSRLVYGFKGRPYEALGIVTEVQRSLVKDSTVDEDEDV
jgi:hypothetical protein